MAICATFFKNAGIRPDQVSILVNHRQLMEKKLLNSELRRIKKKAFQLIDRKDKLDFSAWQAYATEIGLSSDQFTGINDILNDRELWKQSLN